MANEELEQQEGEVEEHEEGVEVEASGEEDARPGKEAEAEEEANAENDEEREAIRERRRQERHAKKQAQREREESMRRELASRDTIINDLTQRLNVIERKGQGTDLAQVDHAIKQSADAYNYYKEQISLAAAQNNGPVLADATEKMIIAQRRYEDLNRIKNTVAQQANKPPPLDPRVATLAGEWLKKRSWYDVNGGDEDSQIAKDIDARLAQAGWNPATPQYWEELDTRLKKYLPHRYKTAYNGDKSTQRSPVAGSGRESAPSQGSGSYKLSADRVKALKDAGKWDDPKEREKAIQYYKNYDKQLSAAGN